MFSEDTSKTSQGGLLHHDRALKKVTHYENKGSLHCLVQLFKKYNARCPPDKPARAFYLKLLKQPKGNVWYQKAPVGHNTLGKIISHLMQNANIPATSQIIHSLSSTVATRLFNAHVDKQLIMERTGHSSMKGIRVITHMIHVNISMYCSTSCHLQASD